VKHKNTKYIELLNKLLASYQIHCQNLRALHWNVKGIHFFELHQKYEELYSRTLLISDEVAERILTIGGIPLSRYSDYLAQSILKENETISDGTRGVHYLVNAQMELLELEKKVLSLTEQEADEGTNALLSDLIREKEKSNWMFSAWLG
jgi:starvation-inducible DNA-binding protein